MNETIYNRNHMIGVEELNPPFREVPFFQLMTEFCDGYSDFYTSGCENFAVVWNYADDAGFFEEIHIQQIYNHDTGEVYWEDNFDEADTPSGRDWSLNDEILYCSLLMWAEVEQTIA